jgi:hypothetical protein
MTISPMGMRGGYFCQNFTKKKIPKFESIRKKRQEIFGKILKIIHSFGRG